MRRTCARSTPFESTSGIGKSVGSVLLTRSLYQPRCALGVAYRSSKFFGPGAPKAESPMFIGFLWVGGRPHPLGFTLFSLARVAVADGQCQSAVWRPCPLGRRMAVDQLLNGSWLRRWVGRAALESFWLLNETGAGCQLGGCGLRHEGVRAARQARCSHGASQPWPASVAKILARWRPQRSERARC